MDEQLKKITKELKKFGIERILVVDDKVENLKAANEIFKGIKNVKFDYSKSAADAINRIKKNYPSKAYDFVFTDLEMENKDSGMEVSKEAFTYQSYPFIITQRGTGGNHGYGTTIYPICYKKWEDSVFFSPKSDPFTWRQAIYCILENFNYNLLKALKKVRKLGIPNEKNWDAHRFPIR